MNWREAVRQRAEDFNYSQAEQCKRLGSREYAGYGESTTAAECTEEAERCKFSRPRKRRCGNSGGGVSARYSGADAT